ncbi:MAG: hypothetical protein KAR39_07515 [Thermoplasmata archaeon]|nr:hypothetical protein [Thermoplasmata archaeon]
MALKGDGVFERLEKIEMRRDKRLAKMLFNMHLVSKKFRQKSPGLDYYNSEQFMLSIQYLGGIDMSEGDRIAHAYPSYEFVVQFKNGDLTLFTTDGGDFRALRTMDVVEKEEFLASLVNEDYGMATYWEQMNRVIFVPNTEMVWGAPL